MPSVNNGMHRRTRAMLEKSSQNGNDLDFMVQSYKIMFFWIIEFLLSGCIVSSEWGGG
jgi:hypothetical protein